MVQKLGKGKQNIKAKKRPMKPSDGSSSTGLAMPIESAADVAALRFIKS